MSTPAIVLIISSFTMVCILVYCHKTHYILGEENELGWTAGVVAFVIFVSAIFTLFGVG